DTGVVTIGGPDFGILGEGYLRLSYANSTENILKALDPIGEFLAKRKAAVRSNRCLEELFRSCWSLLLPVQRRRRRFTTINAPTARTSRWRSIRRPRRPTCRSTASRWCCRSGSC